MNYEEIEKRWYERAGEIGETAVVESFNELVDGHVTTRGGRLLVAAAFTVACVEATLVTLESAKNEQFKAACEETRSGLLQAALAFAKALPEGERPKAEELGALLNIEKLSMHHTVVGVARRMDEDIQGINIGLAYMGISSGMISLIEPEAKDAQHTATQRTKRLLEVLNATASDVDLGPSIH